MTKLLVVFAAVLASALGVPASEKQVKIDPSLSWRVVGGSDAPDGAYPYQISLRLDGSHSCGGSIVNPITILTAAHCVNGTLASRLIVVVGSNKLNSGGVQHAVKTIKVHEKYHRPPTRKDIALVILSTPIQYSETVGPVALETSDVGAGVDAVLSGWGRTSYPGSIPNNLQEINLKTISVSDCKSRHPIFPGVGVSQICTLTKIGEGACHGDSGGPLVADGRQIGIVSWGRPCGVGYPDVFTRVSSFIDWINANSE